LGVLLLHGRELLAESVRLVGARLEGDDLLLERAHLGGARVEGGARLLEVGAVAPEAIELVLLLAVLDELGGARRRLLLERGAEPLDLGAALLEGGAERRDLGLVRARARVRERLAEALDLELVLG